MNTIPRDLEEYYQSVKSEIYKKLKEFKSASEDTYFYELVYCLCTPMSKAENALIVQKEFEQRNYLESQFDVIPLLSNPDNYIRFHNQKANYIKNAYEKFEIIMKIIKSDSSTFDKREMLVSNVKGIGFKEASHFLRNIGFFGLAILDRHILRNMVNFKLISENYKATTKNNYINIEKIFINHSKLFNLEVEEFDLLLWSKETGKILK